MYDLPENDESNVADLEKDVNIQHTFNSSSLKVSGDPNTENITQYRVTRQVDY